ncbi:SepM family pheromone-processing serine protease [Bacillus sp. SCS-151]|uniref:SepM family pheromone-processing serine protease n=1 Tax=Nanhaiella sioensis TaxID=3115293 RepID=UPI00397980BD
MKTKSYIRSLFIGIILAMLITFVQLPFYITKPGTAQELAPIVQVDGGYEEEGSLMLTTVRMGKANVVSYIWAKLSEYQMIYPEQDILQDRSDEEYSYIQLHNMENSKNSAITVAYNQADKSIEYKYNGLFVFTVLDNVPAKDFLKTADRIIRVDDKDVKSYEDLTHYLSTKQEGDVIEVVVERDGETVVQDIELITLENKEQVGLGVQLIEDVELNVNPSVEINSEKIGGPSAGLMFTLEIYNQLVEEDLTKGYDIAGTGQIFNDGTVGPIGGISQKIVAADKAGAEIFFAPNQNGASDSNYNEAVKTAQDIGTSMEIVPVDTFEDALLYLQSIQPE